MLIKAAAQSIPSFCMSIFLLPSTLIKELYVMINNFFWVNGSGTSKGIIWSKWEDLCVGKQFDGLGFKNLDLFNFALLGKMGWRLISDPEALVCRVLRAKYFPRGDFLSASLRRNPSQTW